MRRCLRCTVNVAEGAVRAGKTVDNVYVFAKLLETSPDKYHLATGATAASAKLTIGECNGLGLTARFDGRCAWRNFRGCEALRIDTETGEKYVIFAGGKNADSYKKIRGNSYGMWIATEINLHHDTMIKEAFNRQLAARDRRVFWDLNPSSPTSPIYRDYIDRYAEAVKSGEAAENFFNYAHFTIFDNPTVTEDRLHEIISQYDRESVWYRRDILGERCAAEGLVYPLFAKKRGDILLQSSSLSERDVDFVTVGVDFGGNRSKTTFVACAFMRRGGIVIIRDHAIDGGKGEIDPVRVNLEFEKFINGLMEKYSETEVRYAFCDSESQYLINGLRAHMRKKGYALKIGESVKRRIRDRIHCVNSLMASGKFHVLEECTLVARGLAEAVWAPGDDDVRLDNFTSDIDILDAMEYSFERYMAKLV